MPTFTTLFLSLLLLMLLTQLWLGSRQIRYVQRRRRAVPDAFRRQLPLKAHRKAADYTVALARIARVEYVASAALLLFWTLGGGLDLLDRAWRLSGMDVLTAGTAFLLSAFVLMECIELPFNAWRSFVIEKRFGFNRLTPGLFIADQLKNLLLLLLLGAPLAFAVLWIMQQAGEYWWFYAWLLWTGFSLFLVWAYPTLIAPLFNKFRPLQAGVIRRQVQALLKRTGFRSRGIFVIDSSKRTAHGNAYFTGFGRNKRIVFFDSLLKSLRGKEVIAVLAHELGHFKRGHIRQRLIIMMFLSFLGFALLGWLLGQAWFYAGLGMTQPSSHAALILFILASPVFTYFLQPISAWRSRRHEYEADHFAAEKTDARDLISALVRLYRDNARTLTPDPLHSAFYDSHPPAAARIAQLARFL
ncbi:MAG: M48 family metallopeptidase [Gammaproteobacteria bacterium]|nr:M48 family metallopeptidase [Gammaproteobacteria bacterium]